MDFKKAFVTNKDKEVGGVDVPVASGVTLRIARFNNSKMEEHLQRLGKPYSRSIKQGTFPPGEMRNLMAKAMAHHVLLGWKGLEEDGNALEYSPETAERLLTSSRDFFDLVFESSNELQHFRDEGVDEAGKN